MDAGKGLKGLLDSITIVLSTPCEFPSSSLPRRDSANQAYAVLISGIVALVLNLIIPAEPVEGVADDEDHDGHENGHDDEESHGKETSVVEK